MSGEGVLLVASAGFPVEAAGPGPTPAGGLVRFARDKTTGRLGPMIGVSAVGAPSYLAYSPTLSCAYVTSDFSNCPQGSPGYGRKGRVSAFRVGPSGGLGFINDQTCEGQVPCYVTVHQGGRHILSADYGDGTVAVHPVLPDGSIAPASDVVRNEGNGPNGQRQSGPHAHMVKGSGDSDWILVTDLGTDEVVAYTLDLESGRLRRRPGPAARLRPGSGPRHLVFHPSGTVFVVNELRSTVAVFSFDTRSGAMTELGEVPTTVEDVGGHGNAPSGLVLSPDMRFLYVGNRGRDTVMALAVEDGGLVPMDEVAAGGEPRDMAFVGPYLYVANLGSGTVSVFGWGAGSGELSGPLQVVDVPSPSCVVGL
jgi:6-phosphogluconolactonase